MERKDIISAIKDKFPKRIKKLFEKSTRRVYIDIDPKDLTDFVEFIFNGQDARFCTASCVDMRNGMEILYHFSFANMSLVVSLRVYLDKNNLSIDSITPIMKGAEWIEREIHELFGVDFKNHPNLIKLLLPDNWPEGLYPLRRDYKEEDYKARVKEEE
ncbi:MAG: NADH-quinone oxidoreductase subunit C [Candidatus Omnitrophica bacterium]|nr:NADH-quinone oxidoreductase subunit C [Candidatus Omnitrophota bacterium]